MTSQIGPGATGAGSKAMSDPTHSHPELQPSKFLPHVARARDVNSMLQVDHLHTHKKKIDKKFIHMKKGDGFEKKIRKLKKIIHLKKFTDSTNKFTKLKKFTN